MSKSKSKKVKSKKAKTVKKAAKKAKKVAGTAKQIEQTTVDRLQTQVNDHLRKIDDVLMAIGEDRIFSHLIQGVERNIAHLTFEVMSEPDWCKQMGKRHPKIKKALDKQAIYYKDSKDENKELLSLLKQVVKQRGKIAKLHMP